MSKARRHRFTMDLDPKALENVERLQTITDMSKSDLVRDALALYTLAIQAAEQRRTVLIGGVEIWSPGIDMARKKAERA